MCVVTTNKSDCAALLIKPVQHQACVAYEAHSAAYRTAA